MEFTGGRTADDIVKWVLKKTGPASLAVTCEELTKKIEDSKLLLAFFGDATSADFKIFEETANGAAVGEKFTFVHTDKECGATHGAKEDNSVVLFRKFDESPLVFPGKIENPALEVFASTSSVPTLIDFSEDYIESIFGAKKSAVFLFRSADQTDADFAKVFAKASVELKGKILFVQSGVTDGI
jgi:protein disulfide-isomerase A1